MRAIARALRPRALRGPAAVAVALILLGTAWMWKIAWRSPAHYVAESNVRIRLPLMTADEYDRIAGTHARPYVYEARLGSGVARVFGATHTKDPDDPQISDLRRQFFEFAPSVVLVEGRPGSPVAGLVNPVKEFGEAGLAVMLARKAGIAYWSWEPTREAETHAMLQVFPKERVALFYILRPYVSNLRHGKPADPAAALEEIRAKRVRWPGLEDSFANIGEIDALWARDFRGWPDWRDTTDEFGWPGYLSEIALRSRDLRTENMARCVLDLCGKGERVLVVCGSSHAARAKAAIEGGACDR